MSCTNEKQRITKLFKVACLAYQSGQVEYRGQRFSKQQTFELRKLLAGNCISLIKGSLRFSDLALTPKRIFDDIVVSTIGKNTIQLREMT